MLSSFLKGAGIEQGEMKMARLFTSFVKKQLN